MSHKAKSSHHKEKYTMPSESVYLGIDVSKQELHLNGLGLALRKVPNTRPALQRLALRLKQRPNAVVCCEATGGYESLLVQILSDSGIPVALVNPKRVRDFAKSKGILAKTDQLDAAVLRSFAEQNQPRPLQALPKDLAELRSLLLRREQLVEALKCEKQRLDPKPPQIVLQSLRAHIAVLQRHLDKLEKAIKQLVADHDPLAQKVAGYTRVNSIGLQSALYLTAFVPELGRITDQQAAALVGLAPFNVDSGQFRGRRCIRGGRPRVRRILYMAAVCGKTTNPILRDFYNRLIARGKPPKLALTAVMRKLVLLANRIAGDPAFVPA